MQEIIEKIIERLKENQKHALEKYCKATESYEIVDYGNVANVYGNAIEIVNQVAEEYMQSNAKQMQSSDDGWIPCSVRKPDKSGLYIVSYEGYDSACVESFNGELFDEHVYFKQPTAWMPLPEPYQPKGEQEYK